jgi:hypothetical protein
MATEEEHPDQSIEDMQEELVELLKGVTAQGKKLEAMGREAIQAGRLSQDVAPGMVEVYATIPASSLPRSDWQREIDNWTGWSTGISQMSNYMPAITGMTVSSVNSAYSTASTSWFGDPGNLGKPTPTAFTYVTKVIERYESADKAIAAMKNLGLDNRGGRSRPATDLLAESKAAMERPVIGDGGPPSILLPLRESINVAVAELLRRRQQQEPTGNAKDKIESIGRHCRHASYTASYFEKIGDEALKLLNELSGGKQAAYARDHLQALFIRGTLLLNSLLEGIDENKLRAP